MYLLDTDYVGILQRKSGPGFGRLMARMALLDPSAFYLPIIAFHEQMMGANLYVSKAKDAESAVRGYRLMNEILTRFAEGQVLPFDEPAATQFDELKLRRVRVGTMDLRIACIALARGLTVLTRNSRDFERVPGLTVQDWTVP